VSESSWAAAVRHSQAALSIKRFSSAGAMQPVCSAAGHAPATVSVDAQK